MSLRITSRALCALSTHARNVAKAAEVLGALKAKPKTTHADVSVEHRQGCRFLCFRGSDGSTLDLPLMGLDAETLDAGALSLAVGLESVAKATGSNASARVDDGELVRLRAALAESAKEASDTRKELMKVRGVGTSSNALVASNALLERANRELHAANEERAQLLATVEELTAALAKANAKPAPAVAPIKARLDAAKADHGSLLDAIVAETAKAKPARVQVAPERQAAPVATIAATVTAEAVDKAALEVLAELEGRSDVETETVGGRVVRVTFKPVGHLPPRQGKGVADSLKARGFAYDAKASKAGGQLVWVR